MIFPGGVMVTQRPLKALFMVRVHAREPRFDASNQRRFGLTAVFYFLVEKLFLFKL